MSQQQLEEITDNNFGTESEHLLEVENFRTWFNTPRGQLRTSAGTLPQGRNGLSAWRMVVLWTFREPSLDRHVRREFMRNVWRDFTP